MHANVFSGRYQPTPFTISHNRHHRKRETRNIRYNVCQCDKDANKGNKKYRNKKKGGHSWYAFCVIVIFYSIYFWHAATVWEAAMTITKPTTSLSYQQQNRIPFGIALLRFLHYLAFYEYIVPLKLIANKENIIRVKRRKKNYVKRKPHAQRTKRKKRKKKKKKIYIKQAHTSLQKKKYPFGTRYIYNK